LMYPARSCRDRTAEFFAAVNSCRPSQDGDAPLHNPVAYYERNDFSEVPLVSKPKHSENGYANGHNFPPSSSSKDSALAHHSEFTRQAATISKGIHEVTRKLEELGRLAKQQSLFNDPIERIQEYTCSIRDDITALSSQCDGLEAFVKARASASSVNKQADQNSANIIQSLKSQVASTAKSFTDILEIRNQNLREQNTRGRKYGDIKSSQALTERLKKRPVTFTDPESDRSATDDADLLETGSFLPKGMRQQQQMIEEEDVFLRSRTEAVRSIESTMAQLTALYQRMATIVAMQGELAVRIDANMDDTLTHVDAGHQQLLKALQSVSSNRALILKVFGILILFAIFFVMFVA